MTLYVQKGSLLRAIRVAENRLNAARASFTPIDIIRLETDYNYLVNCFNYKYGHRDRRFYKKKIATVFDRLIAGY